ncbi:ComEC/Rec2 family competence protein [Runella slithyformis]|uniref:Beta-lactamase domain-containing protein n=1 Tax=Runella slithyformis (strain ATCC 29530 / DSM 19594 / LMG 11500 / NCIMB 11436 / LSU 4) TaxID=761193 RepID=A0A7U3ZRQ7_RUNSL|nr:MBL fold metallo-hydrolase [Runella slithyformis]AEI52160.1 beta-lactamase domain-containing protein [Runella slithyformis DSM 19594]
MEKVIHKYNCIINALPVRCGDCLYINFLDNTSKISRHIIVDAGYSNTYHRTLKPIIDRLAKEGSEIDLFILTHTDGDHIGGMKPHIINFGVNGIKQFWFNYAPTPFTLKDGTDEVSIKQGINLRDYLLKFGKVNSSPILTGHVEKIGDGIITVLSPDNEQFNRFVEEWRNEEPYSEGDVAITTTTTDYSEPIADLIHNEYEPDSSWSNRSSIAFVLQLGSKKVMLTGDAHPDVIISALRTQGYTPDNPIQLELMKISHHGSKANTSDELIKLVDCQCFLISSNEGNKHSFPHKEALARVIWVTHQRRPKTPIHIYFTYNSSILKEIFSSEEQKEFMLICHYPETGNEGITITFCADE